MAKLWPYLSDTKKDQWRKVASTVWNEWTPGGNTKERPDYHVELREYLL